MTHYLDGRGDWIARHNELMRSEFDKLTEVPVITISGERMAGKTEMLIDRMVRHAHEGLTVAYVSHTLRCAANTQGRIMNRLDPEVIKAHRSNGNMQIRYASGGKILFLSSGPHGFRGLQLDAVVWDDVSKPVPFGLQFATKVIYLVLPESDVALATEMIRAAVRMKPEQEVGALAVARMFCKSRGIDAYPIEQAARNGF